MLGFLAGVLVVLGLGPGYVVGFGKGFVVPTAEAINKEDMG
jgi:hypothetical protein